MRTQLKLLVTSLTASLILSPAGLQAAGTTTLAPFFGGDPDEGLDLQGIFLYAFNVGTPGEAGQAGDAYFTADDAPGIKVTAVNQIPNWHAPNYGDSADDDVLEMVMTSMRWTPAPGTVRVELADLQPGLSYKLQLLFAEQCCAGRGFNVVVNDGTIAENFRPAEVQNGAGNKTQGAVVVHEFVADSATLTIVLDGAAATAPEVTDHNAILNGVTLEQVGIPGDTDGDGLPDPWEILYFNNLLQGAQGDVDGDGLTNAEEFAAGTNPTRPDTDGDGLGDAAELRIHGTNPKLKDTDGDGLSDFDEVTTHGTDPKLRDTDGDGLSDSDEVNLSHSNPKVGDTDGDGFSDFTEYYSNTDPNNRKLVPRRIVAGRFTGGDDGEGLDLLGTIPYAFSVGPDTIAAGPAGDANFTLDSEAGILVTAGNSIPNWHVPAYGDTPADDALELVMRSIRWAEEASAKPTVMVDLDNLTPGKRYKAQLLFAEQCCAGRAFDVYVRSVPTDNPYQRFDRSIDSMLSHEFNPAAIQGGAGNTSAGAFLSYEFTAQDTQLHLILDGRGVKQARFTDHNAILNGVTLEELDLGPDTDGDGLPDAWEVAQFGNLGQTASGDKDADGLSNGSEYDLSLEAANPDTDGDGVNDGDEVNIHLTDPTQPDSDGDGLADGTEINVLHTDPNLTDTDGDGLADGVEVNILHTNPLLADTDGDGLPDGSEADFELNPLIPDVAVVSNVVIEQVTGGDEGEGLDLQGSFLYAFNVGPAGAAGQAGDAVFTADNAPGIKVTAPASIPVWDLPDFGDSPADDVIEKVMQSIRYGGMVKVELAGLIPGNTYKLQMLFHEACCGNRGFNVYAEGALVAQDFSPPSVQGGFNFKQGGAVVGAEFVAARSKMIAIATINGRTDPALTDPNAILDGVTLETVAEGARPTLSMVRDALGKIEITTDGTLQVSDNPAGPYTSLPGGSVTVNPAREGGRRFYRGIR